MEIFFQRLGYKFFEYHTYDDNVNSYTVQFLKQV